MKIHCHTNCFRGGGIFDCFIAGILLFGNGFFLGGVAVDAQPDVDETLIPDIPDYVCDNGPDALTEAYGKNIPRSCIDVPIYQTTMERCYYTYVPESCSSSNGSSNNLPLVFDIHGLTSCPFYSAGYTGWMEKAEEECFVVVWPIGNVDVDKWSIQGCWNLPGYARGVDDPVTTNGNYDTDNDEGSKEKYGDVDGSDIITSPCCCYEKPNPEEGNNLGFTPPSVEPNDPLFLRMVIDSVVDSFTDDDSISIDRSRVYMAGHSNGCMTSLTMAALYPDAVAAVCCHSGTLVTPFPSSYDPVPIWMVHGMKDASVAFGGQSIMDLSPFGHFGFWPTLDGMNYIGDHNDCGPVSEEEIFDDKNGTDNSGGAVGKLYKRTNCANAANVELLALYESGHYPFKSTSPELTALFTELSGDNAALTTIDTTAMAWEFCSSHKKAQIPDSYKNDNVVEVGEEEKETNGVDESDDLEEKTNDVDATNTTTLGETNVTEDEETDSSSSFPKRTTVSASLHSAMMVLSFGIVLIML